MASLWEEIGVFKKYVSSHIKKKRNMFLLPAPIRLPGGSPFLSALPLIRKNEKLKGNNKIQWAESDVNGWSGAGFTVPVSKSRFISGRNQIGGNRVVGDRILVHLYNIDQVYSWEGFDKKIGVKILMSDEIEKIKTKKWNTDLFVLGFLLLLCLNRWNPCGYMDQIGLKRGG